MALEYFDLFEELGIKPEEPKKKEKKKKEKKKGETSNKKVAKGDKIKLPAVVYTGYSEALTLSGKDFGGKTEITLKEAHEYLASVCPDYPLGISDLQKGKKDILYLVHKGNYVVLKATLRINKDTRMMLGGTSYDISILKTAEECDVECADLEKHFGTLFTEYSKVGFIHSAIDNIIVPSFNYPLLTEEADFPVRVGVFGRNDLVINKEDYIEFISKATDKDKEDDEDSDNISDKKEVLKARKEIIEGIIVQNYQDFAEEHLELQWNEKDKLVIAKMVENTFKQGEPKKEEYPTNATLSLLYTTINLSPEMFGGKNKVEAEELRKYIEKDRPEYSKERTSIGYDKEKNLIIMTVNGSRKGAELICDSNIAMDKISSKDDVLFDWYKDGNLFRVEKTSAFCVMAPKVSDNEGGFALLLPKVPGGMHHMAMKLFEVIYDRYKTEAMLQLFWDDEKKEYFWFVPFQNVGTGYCNVIRDTSMEIAFSLIGDFHSHGYYSSYFSRQDNEDEKGFRIFGVYGDFDNDKNGPVLKLRAGTGGCFVNIHYSDVFSDDNGYDEYVFQSLVKEIDAKVNPMY